MSRKVYTARATREGKWWAIEVEGVENAFSQAKRLDQVEAMAREVVALLLDVPEDSFDVIVETELPAEWAAFLDDLRESQMASAEATRKLSEYLRKAAKDLHDAGLPVRDVGSLMGVSPQRVSQLINDEKVSV